ncbi:hypothetical protein RB653_003702 [Dictyostelium firmibasis]|uniref:RNA helicase n=1 Tax=Dictyostelium firmibasis TaxID=79012 RepID=A0AAN7TYC4_9MYCE
MKGKKLESKSYQKALQSKGNDGLQEQAKRLKKKEDFKKKLEKRQNTIVIKDKLKEPSTFLKEDQSFFDQNIFNDHDEYKQQQMNRININENFETNLFSDMINEFDGDLNDDLDLLDYNDDATFNDDNDNQYGSEDEEFYKGSNEDDDNDDYKEKSSSKKNKKQGKENVEIETEKFESFPMDENNEQEEEVNSKKKKKTGGFQSMELNKNLLKSILKKGFNVPTPIQRKSIPMILDGHDVVGMARTGSGKTGAFVIPMIQKLGDHSTTVGVRAVILSPTRELAIQTFKVVKDFSHGTQLRTVLIVGGDSMEDQFTDLARNPDIIIATPGRLMHHLLETGISLSKVQYIVFDEADRLFEMGFNEQLTEILSKLSENRQTLLFSATLPSLLVDFVRAGLNNPKLINLDTDTKISENLSLSFFTLRQEEKLGVLLFLIKDIIYKKIESTTTNEPTKKPSTIIFVSTKYHVEFIHILLERAGIASTYIHGYLDPVARKINLAKFRSHQVGIMVVTDLAARGIDIPLLDNVINFDFPPKEKIFIHRVGRVARAGRSGIAYSLVSPDEIPYMIDLHLYLGRKFLNKFENESQTINDPKYSFYGTIPQTIIDRETEFVNIQRKECVELLSLTKTIYNAHKKYLSTRPGASHESNKRAKAMDKSRYHPMLNDQLNSNDQIRNDFIQSLKSFRPPQTVLELDARKNNVQVSIMKDKRKVHTNAIESQQKKLYLQQSSETNLGPENEEFDYSKLNSRKRLSQTTENITEEMFKSSKPNNNEQKNNNDIEMKDSDNEDDENNDEDEDEDDDEDDENEEQDDEDNENNNKFNIKIESSNKNDDNKKKSKSRSSSRDPNFFISATPENLIQERAMSISNRFTKDDEVNLVADTDRKQKKSMVWDKRKGKFVSSQADADRKNSKKLVRNEAGKLVEAKKSHKGYEEWKKKTHGRIQRVGEDENAKYQPNQKEYLPQKWRGQGKEKEKKENKVSHAKGSHGLKGRPQELKDRNQISKNRTEKERKMRVNKSKGNPKGSKSKSSGGGGGGKGSKFGSGKPKGGKGGRK